MKSRRGHHGTVIAALQKVAAILKEAKVDFAGADGYAGWARAGPEPGDDADVSLAPRDLSFAVRALKEAGLRSSSHLRTGFARCTSAAAAAPAMRPARRGGPHSSPLRPARHPRGLERAELLNVNSVYLPVLTGTDVLVSQLLALYEKYCDLAQLLPLARAVREQVDWAKVRAATVESPYAAAFLLVAERLDLLPPSSHIDASPR